MLSLSIELCKYFILFENLQQIMSIVHVDLPAHGLIVLPLFPTDRQQSIPKPIFS